MDTKLRSFRYSIWFKCVVMAIALAGFLATVCYGMMAAYNYSYTGSFAGGEPKYADAKYRNEVMQAHYELLEYYIINPSSKNAGPEQRRLNEYRQAELMTRINSYINLRYLVIDLKTDERFTNFDGYDTDSIKSVIMNAEYFYATSPYSPYLQFRNEDGTTTSMGHHVADDSYACEIYMTVAAPLSPGDMFYDAAEHYDANAALAGRNFRMFCVGGLVFLAAVVCLISTAGRVRRDDALHMLPTDRLYNDLAVAALVSVYAIIFGGQPTYAVAILPKNILYGGLFSIISVVLALSLLFAVSAHYVLSVARHVKRGTLLSHTLVAAGLRLIGKAYRLATRSSLRGGTAAFVLGYGVMSAVLTFMAVIPRRGDIAIIFFFIWLIVTVAGAVGIVKHMSALDAVIHATASTVRHGVPYSRPEVGERSPFRGFSEDIAAIHLGYGQAVEQAVRGERMKAELITNVSHDLKTPLTSIINYVELLKKEQGLSETSVGYVEVLDQKAQRLRRLCDDLFDAAKATSGSVAASPEAVNLYELVRQAEGEYAESIEHAGLDIRVTAAQMPVIVRADRQHIFRVVDNLFSNLVKYAMPNSRVYIELTSNGFGRIVMKNVSKDALNMPADSLTERFVRGDAARSEEGSGLGLAIARGLCEAQGGQLLLFIDGDLFRSEAVLPLWSE